MSVYVGTTGTTTYLPNGRRGVVTGINYRTPNRQPDSVFVATVDEEQSEMWLVTLGERLENTRGFYAIAGTRRIDRDEFDRIAGLTDLRREMGWVA
ncbi:MAG TPA: hypothetical protein VIO38_07235 [Rariglobus sp.]